MPRDPRPARLCRLAPLCVVLVSLRVPAFEMEMGAVTAQDTFTTPAWTTVTFIRPFSLRPVVAVLPTNDGGDPATIRIRNVTTAGFELLQVEAAATDGPHVAMPTAYVAVEPGDHLLPDGSRVAALEHSTTSFANRLLSTTWDTVFFPTPFTGTPAVLAQIQTMANESQNPPATSSAPFMDVGVRSVGTASLQVTLERAESTAGSVTAAERVGIVAITNGANLSFTDTLGNNIVLQGLLTATNVQGWDNGCFVNSYPAPFSATPLSVASANTRSGNNGGWVRRCSQGSASIGLTIDEDTDTDSERAHIAEAAGVVAASAAFHATFAPDLLVSKNYNLLSDPYNGASNPKNIPSADGEYVIGIANRGSASPDTDTLVITDDLPAQVRLCVTASCQAGGPVVLDTSASPVPPGVTIGTVAYSNDGGSSYTYVPIPDADGFDSAVDAVQVTMDGALAPIAPGGSPSFELVLAVRIN
ncbi:MAG: hypothetical protein KJO31_16895 [Gammaproteobacteria bacterium]|nr:hypothetical protein [Gammaproteobacteria bacterium]